ncbi:hypothetical protein B0H19DRAFT_1087788 [Mycena capillaripes]|nr:hypothetical protein B0H19DRAFT_1087788 [Mycena capillaripes]
MSVANSAIFAAIWRPVSTIVPRNINLNNSATWGCVASRRMNDTAHRKSCLHGRPDTKPRRLISRKSETGTRGRIMDPKSSVEGASEEQGVGGRVGACRR